MGTKFSKLWEDPEFIDSYQKAKIESEVSTIGKWIEIRESENSQELNEDPIIGEIRKSREQLLENHGSLDGFLEHIRKQEQEHPEKLIDPKQANPRFEPFGNSEELLPLN